MAGETVLTMVGNLTGDPELRFTPSGAAVASFTVACTPRAYDKNANEWKDGEPLFMRCSAWRTLGENVAESFARGDRVVVVGKLKQRSFETREGEKRTVIEMDCDEVAGSARFTTVKVLKASRASTGGQQSQTAAADLWGGSSNTDEPPFLRRPEPWERGEAPFC